MPRTYPPPPKAGTQANAQTRRAPSPPPTPSSSIYPQRMPGAYYPMPWQGPNSRATHDTATLYHAVCRLHELILKHVLVWEVRMLFILNLFSEVVISFFCSTNINALTWRQQICTQLARTWDRRGDLYQFMPCRFSMKSRIHPNGGS